MTPSRPQMSTYSSSACLSVKSGSDVPKPTSVHNDGRYPNPPLTLLPSLWLQLPHLATLDADGKL